MNILFTICGRAGSKGIKNKNIRNFLDKPLVYFTVSTIDLFLSNHSEIAYDIVLNTDSLELQSLIERNNMRNVLCLQRKKELAGDNVGKVDVIRNCLKECESQKNSYDFVIDLDITSPLRGVNDLQKVYDEIKTAKYDVVFTVAEARRNPYFNMVKQNEKGFYERVINSNYSARQQAPVIYDMNASIYAYKTDFLRKNNNIFAGKCGIVKMKDTGILDLDHENDFELMEALAQYFVRNDEAFNEVYSNIV